MNQEQNKLNLNNFNTQGNNGIPNNQQLNNQNFNQSMGVNQQPINPQPQQTPGFEQPINQMNMQQPTPQPMNNRFESGNASNQSFNSKPPKKMNLGLIIGIVAVVAVVGVGIVFGSKLLLNDNNNDSSMNGNGIERLNVDLEKYELSCLNEALCNEIKGNIVQIIGYVSQTKSNNYDNLILVQNGDVYLYNSYTKELLKTIGGTELTKIDGIIASFHHTNPIIYEGTKYYELKYEEPKIKKIDLGFTADQIFYINSNDAWVIDNNKIVNITKCSSIKNYVSNDVCSNAENYVKLVPWEKSFLNQKIEKADSMFYIGENKKLYSMAMGELDYNSLTYRMSKEVDGVNLPNDDSDIPILMDVSNFWSWSYDADDSHSNFIAQTEDGKLYHNYGYFLDEKFNIIDIGEKMDDIKFSKEKDYFLAIGIKNIYLIHIDYNNQYNVIKLDKLSKYKNNIRGLFVEGNNVLVLLNDGNLYKVHG